MSAKTAALLRALPSLTGTAPHLTADTLPPEPTEFFLRWLDEAIAAKVMEPHAATLATVDADGVPDARTLILKDVDEHGWAIAGTASSRKGQQLESHPVAALNFWWPEMVRAIRVRGTVTVAPPADIEADLARRSASARSLIAPGEWKVWRIHPSRVEFWQGSTDRHHTRIFAI